MNHVRGSSIWDSWIILASWATDAAPVIFWSMEDQVAQPWWEQHLEVGPLFLLGGNRGGFTGKLSANEWSWIKHTHLLFRISLAMGVTCVILGMVLLLLRTKRRIWSLSCRVEESCLTRLEVTPQSRADAIMNHNKESQALASLVGLLFGMQSSTFESRIWVLLSSRQVRLACRR